MLLVLAHADDETLLAGALIATLTGIGNEVTVLCLAPGDADRKRRLQGACDILGVSKVETLRYAGGAMWPDEAQDSNSLSRADRTGDRALEPVLGAAPVLGVVRTDSYDRAEEITHTFLTGGLRMIEITFSVPRATEIEVQPTSRRRIG